MNQEMDMRRKKMEMEMEMPIRYTYYLARTHPRTHACEIGRRPVPPTGKPVGHITR